MRFTKFVSMVLAMLLLIASLPVFDEAAMAAGMPYRITVDLTNQIVTVYSTSTGQIVRQCLCSSGAKDATPTGTFTMPSAEREGERSPWFHFRAFGGYARYVSRIYYDVMFHSLIYNHPNVRSLDPQSVRDYGKPVSHGCIRMRWQDAKFIAKKCLKGTKVKIYKSGEVDHDLRQLLYQSSYTSQDGMSYKEFLGIPDEEGVMGRYSTGEDVRNLQMRLSDLGIFSDVVDGVYQVSTVTAVREAQSMMGMQQTGIATLDFQKAIYAGDAPFSMNVTLREGKSGPVVKSLQENLSRLGLYEGDIDSVYDVDVIEAVKVFQSAYGCDIDGVATPTLQKAIYYEAGRMEALFSSVGGCHMEKVDEKIYMGRVTCELGIRLRKKPSIQSSALGVLKKDDIVVVVEGGSVWSLVMKGSRKGYVKNEYVSYYPQTISSLRYTAEGTDTVYTLGYTAADYFSGAKRPADAFLEYLNSGGSLDDYDGLTSFVTVDTENDDITLNLREAPNTNSTILAALNRGAQAKVIVRSDEWSMVEYNGLSGYLLNEYLEFWTGPEDALDVDTGSDDEDEDGYYLSDDSDADDYGVEHALVSCDTADKAKVYAEDSMDATVLGNLPNGTQVEVTRTINGWSYISYNGRQGYMREQDLKFVLTGIAV